MSVFGPITLDESNVHTIASSIRQLFGNGLLVMKIVAYGTETVHRGVTFGMLDDGQGVYPYIAPDNAASLTLIIDIIGMSCYIEKFEAQHGITLTSDGQMLYIKNDLGKRELFITKPSP
jgi:hypothetical protein